MSKFNIVASLRLHTCKPGILLFAFLLFCQHPAFGAPPAPIEQSALDQIGALLAEKASWTPIQAKMDSELIRAEKTQTKQKFAAGVPSMALDVKMQPDGRVLVDITANVSPELLALIKQGGGQVINSVPELRAIRALVTLGQLETVATSGDVSFIQRAVPALTNTGSVDSQGDVTHQVGAARTAFGVTGAGIKVGVLSDSVDFLANSQTLGDLGTVTVLPGQAGSGAGEGTAMLEIVHDLAPDAQLYFATAFGSEAGFAQNIISLYNSGCNIIVDDVGYFDESPFQDGVVAQAVNTVTAGGALYFSSAANSGNLTDGTSGTWEGDFVDGGAAASPIPEAGRIHSFGATAYNTVVTTGSSLDLFWADPLGAATNDYDLFLLNSTGTSVAGSSMTRQTGSQNPYERIASMSAGQRVVIVKFSGAARFLHLDTQRGTLSIPTSGATTGHSATTNAFSVAACPAAGAFSAGNPAGPFPNAFTTTNLVEKFSSDGPRHVFYQADGSPITPGDFSSTGGAIRQKPDIAAADGVVTTLGAGSGLNPFYGTSAAAPHAGAIAALLWSYNPSLTPAQIRTLLTGSALDIMSPGIDRDSGAGIVMPYQILTNLSGTSPPGINLQPANQSVAAGGTATFSVTAVATPPFTYAWQRNGSPIAGATLSSYSTNNVQLADSGTLFSCLIGSGQGSLLSSNGLLTVFVGPTNDLCSGATIISNANYTTTQSTTAATSAGDPSPTCVPSLGNGVWFQYTAPSNGQFTVDTIGSSFDTVLGLYSGSCGSLTQLACNDDGGGNVASLITSAATAGTTYYILAGGYTGASGNLIFHLVFTATAPSISNDLCSGATVVSTPTYANTQSTATATSAGDPAPSCVTSLGKGVWYTFTPGSNGSLSVDTSGSSFDTALGLYSGTCGSLTQLGCNDDAIPGSDLTSKITNSVTGGTAYFILAGGYNSAAGTLVFHLAFTPAPAGPNITVQPASQTAPVGSNVTFTVTATGSAPLTYFWKLNNSLVAASTSSSYTTNNVQLSNSGSQYSCLVSNTLGTAPSSNAVLTVIPAGLDLIKFDDLTDTASGLAIPAAYHSLTWSNLFEFNSFRFAGNPSGYQPATLSVSNVIDNGVGTPASITSTTPFNFISAYLTAAWNDGLQVEVKGYAGNTLAHDNTYALSATSATFVNFAYAGVTRVDFISSGGTHHAGYGGTGTQFAMDNMTVAIGPASAPLFVPSSPTSLLNGQFQFALAGTAGSNYDILVSTNLQTWVTLKTLTMTNSTSIFVDTNMNQAARYYRARLAP